MNGPGHMLRAAHARTKGYSLIELLVVLAVLAVLSLLTMPVAELVQQREKERELKRALWSLRAAIDGYYDARTSGAIVADDGSSKYPPDLAALTALHRDARTATLGQPIRFLRAIPRDPFAPSDKPAQETWSLRSFESDADAPRAGADVYDVYSSSTKRALNGTPLKEW